MGQYDWVADKKREAMFKKLQNRGLPTYSQIPMGERTGISFTGLGNDGKLQKNNPAGLGTGHVYHEGETKIDTPEGSAYITADLTKMAGLRQYATGGMDLRNPRARGVPGETATATTQEIVPQTTQAPTRNTLGSTAINALNVPTQSAQTIQAPTRNVTPQVGTTTNAQTIPGQQTIQTVAPTRTQAPATQVNALTMPETKIEPIAPVYTPTKPDTLASRSTVTPQWQTETPAATAEDAARTTGINYLTDSLSGKSGIQMQGEQDLDALRLRQQQEQSATRQIATQAGMSDTNSSLAAQRLIAGQESEANTLASKYGIAAATEKLNTANTLASQGLSGQQFEENKKQYGDSQGWKAYEEAVAAGDFTTAAGAYQSITGNSISMEQMQRDQDYMNTKQGQDVVSGQLSIDAQKLGITSDTMNSIISDINNGVPLETINASYGTSLTNSQFGSIGETYNTKLSSLKNALGDEVYNSVKDRVGTGATYDQLKSEYPGITSEQYSSMLQASALGEREWNKKLTAANMLLATEGAANKESAAAIYSQVFPGVDFDFSKVITDENNKSFASAMTEMSNYALADMNSEEALLAMEKSGALSKMGMTKDDAAVLYNGMKVNAIDAQWEEMEQSDVFKNMSEDEQAAQREFFEQSITGQLDYSMLNEYEIYDGDELVTTIYGKDSTEADKYATSNNKTVKSTGNVKFQMASTLNTVPTSNTETSTDRYNKVVETAPADTGTSSALFDKAEKISGKTITNYDDYKKVVEEYPQLKLESITATGKDLLEKTTASTINEVWKADPDAVRSSSLYFKAPTPEEIAQNVTADYKSGLLGIGAKNEVTISDDFKSTFEGAVGKVMEIPTKGGVVTGQVTGIKPTAHTVQIKLTLADGTTKSVPIVSFGSTYTDANGDVKYYGDIA